MGDMSKTIVIKSDQLNNEDLMDGPITIEIVKTKVAESGEQPVSISYVGDNGKPYKPGLSMRKVIIEIWGDESKVYAGRKMTLYRDKTIKFGKVVWGGIRISHMSHMAEDERVMYLTKTRGVKEPFIVRRLVSDAALPAVTEVIDVESLKKEAPAIAEKGSDELKAWWKKIGPKAQNLLGEPYLVELKAIAAKADAPSPVETGGVSFGDEEGPGM